MENKIRAGAQNRWPKNFTRQFKSIIEYNGIKRKIEIPVKIKDLALRVDVLAEKEPSTKQFDDAYGELSAYYSEMANSVFNKSGLWVEGFMQRTEAMKKRGIVHYVRVWKMNYNESRPNRG